MNLTHRPLGVASYGEAWELQRQARRALQQRPDAPEVVFTVEHPAVLTAGTRAAPENLRADEPSLRARGVAIEHIERGGDWTYHGPGQLVVYPIVSLRRRRMGAKAYVAGLEATMERLARRALAAAGADAGVSLIRKCGAPGLWARRDDGSTCKLGAVGVHISRGVTLHGLALNLDPDPWGFDWIVPCGLAGEETSSVAALVRESGGDVGALPSVVEAGRWAFDVLADELDARSSVRPG